MSDDNLIQAAERLSRYDWQDWTAQDIEDAEGIVRAYRAIAALPAVQVGVKPLEWGVTAKREWTALGAAGYSSIVETLSPKGKFHEVIHAFGVLHDTLEAAKAAAQADYEARIRSALTVQPAPAQTPDVAALIEALRRWESYGCPDCGSDCGSANPPVSCCIMQETRAALAALEGRADD